MTDPSIRFLALPNCPHLTHTWCGYSLLSLLGLSPLTTTGKVSLITVNGVKWETRPMGDNALMLIPAIKQEGQRVSVYLSKPVQPHRAFESHQATTAPPNDTYGFTAPSNAYKRTPNGYA